MKNKRLIKESGIRDINAIANRYPKAEIYFHQDLDGVVTAIAMKEYLEKYGITVIDSHVIQYGDKEFSVKNKSWSFRDWSEDDRVSFFEGFTREYLKYANERARNGVDGSYEIQDKTRTE